MASNNLANDMAFYESIFIIRQDVASADVDKVASDFEAIIKEFKGEVLKKEYWGLRTLAYEIQNNKKGHYYLLGIKASNALLKELDKKIKLSESIIRSSLIKVKEISDKPSPILKTDSNESGKTVDVTISK